MNPESTTSMRRVELLARRGFTWRSRYNANCFAQEEILGGQPCSGSQAAPDDLQNIDEETEGCPGHRRCA